MVRKLALLLSAAILLVAATLSAAETPGGTPATQGELAKKLVDLFGWSEGVPEKPTDRDYLTILGGERRFRFEAEDVYDRYYDTVTVRNYNLFGPFTGRGWIHGTTAATAVHFKVLIPIAGKYTLTASTKGDDQLWSVAGKAFKVNAGANLKETVIGQVFLPPGYLEFNAVIPPGGAIDYLLFSAPALATVAPVAGWNFPAPLTGGQLAEVAVALLGSEGELPEDTAAPHRTLAAAAVSPLPEAFYLTDSQLYGKPLAGKWVRGGLTEAKLTIPVEIDTPAAYRLRVRSVGSPLTAGFGERAVTRTGMPYLEWVDCGMFRLGKGMASLTVLVPPTGGVDTVELARRNSAPDDYVAVAKLGKRADEIITSAELDRLLKQLQEKFKERQ